LAYQSELCHRNDPALSTSTAEKGDFQLADSAVCFPGSKSVISGVDMLGIDGAVIPRKNFVCEEFSHGATSEARWYIWMFGPDYGINCGGANTDALDPGLE
jgi:hypothetical protein